MDTLPNEIIEGHILGNLTRKDLLSFQQVQKKYTSMSQRAIEKHTGNVTEKLFPYTTNGTKSLGNLIDILRDMNINMRTEEYRNKIATKLYPRHFTNEEIGYILYETSMGRSVKNTRKMFLFVNDVQQRMMEDILLNLSEEELNELEKRLKAKKLKAKNL